MGNNSIFIVSYGGTGSKLITKLIHRNISPIEMAYYHKHDRYIKDLFLGEKIVYVFGDPRNTVISFFLRREVRHENHGFERMSNTKKPMPRFVQWALENLECGTTAIDENWDIACYLENTKYDIFGLEDHFDRWILASAKLDVLFVSYDALWSVPEILCSELAIPLDLIPKRKPRRADWRLLPEGQKVRINELYGKFSERLQSFPLIFRTRDLDL